MSSHAGISVGRHLRPAGVLLFLLVALCACRPAECTDPLGCVDIPPGAPLRIGLLLPFSGPDAAFGEQQRQLLEQFFQARQLIGHPFELIVLDNDCTGAGDVRAATELAQQDDLAMVLGSPCADSEGVRILSDAGLSLVPLTAADPLSDARRTLEILHSVTIRDLTGRLSIPRAALRAALEQK